MSFPKFNQTTAGAEVSLLEFSVLLFGVVGEPLHFNSQPVFQEVSNRPQFAFLQGRFSFSFLPCIDTL